MSGRPYVDFRALAKGDRVGWQGANGDTFTATISNTHTDSETGVTTITLGETE